MARPGGSYAGLIDLCYLPFTLAWNIIFYPAHGFMHVVIDLLAGEVLRKNVKTDKQGKQKVADEVQFRCPWLMGIKVGDKVEGGVPWFQHMAAYLKSYRYVLYSTVKWTAVPTPIWKCKGCGAKSSFFCVECNKRYCPQCAYLIHAPGTFGNAHSVEKLAKRWQKHCHFITPILPEIMFLVCATYVCLHVTLISEDYLTTQVSCPLVTYVRHWTGLLDTNLMYHNKAHFFSACDMEDSFLRFLLDAWVRGIVTGTDNTLLVFQTLPQAALFTVVLTYTIVPVISVIYAFVLNLFYQLEICLPQNAVLLEASKLAHYCTWPGELILGQSTDIPPETEPRMRPDIDVGDWLRYEWARKMKHAKYYYRTTLDGLDKFSWGLLKATVVLRLLDIWLGLAAPFRFIFSILPVIRDTVRTHMEWFHVASSNMVVSEDHLRSAGQKGLDAFFLVIPTSCIWAWVVLSVIAYVAVAFFCHKLLMQRQQKEKVHYHWGGSRAASTDWIEQLHAPKTLLAKSLG